jgi:acetyl-CoA C-acetyltransferase
VRSHHNLATAYGSGYEDDLVSPFLGLERDQNLRPDSTVEKLAKLKPVFGGADGTMTAGNSTPLSDGAAAVLLASEEWAADRGLAVRAYLRDAQTAAVDHVHDPVFCRERRGLAEPLGAIDRDKLNVRGGSLGAGHPFGATGGRIVANLAKLLGERGSGRGLISICAAGGLGVVAVMES